MEKGQSQEERSSNADRPDLDQTKALADFLGLLARGNETLDLGERTHELLRELKALGFSHFEFSRLLHQSILKDEANTRPNLRKMRILAVYSAMLSAMKAIGEITSPLERAEIVERLTSDRLSGFVRESGLSPSCQKSCSACCHTQITLAPSEALRIKHFLEDEARTWDRERAMRQAKVKEAEAYPLTLDWTDSACLFLDEVGACSVYSVRPISCRKVLVVSEPSACDPRVKRYPSYAVSRDVEILASAFYNVERRASPLLTTISSYFAESDQIDSE